MKQINVTQMNSQERKKAINEIRILASVASCPYLVRFYEAFLENDTLYIVTDYAAQGDLLSHIKRHYKRRTHFPERQCWSYLIQVVTSPAHCGGGPIALLRFHSNPRDNVFVTVERSPPLRETHQIIDTSLRMRPLEPSLNSSLLLASRASCNPTAQPCFSTPLPQPFSSPQLCIGMQYLHRHKILHRDLKSANLFVTDDGVLKIGDFGISKVRRASHASCT